MAAVPSAINLITNHLSELDKEKAVDNNSTNSSETILAKDSYNDKDKLVEEGDEKKCFVQIYNKFWPFRVLKITNLLLLFILANGTYLTYRSSLYWASLYPRPYNMNDKFVFGQYVLLIFAFCSLIVHRFAKNKFMASVFSLMDICFLAISIPTLILVTIAYSLKSVALYRLFGAKLANFNYTYDASIDLTESSKKDFTYYSSFYHHEYYTSLLEQVENRKKQIIIHLLFDPINSLSSGIALFISILLIIRLYKMRKANIWASGVNSYNTLFPNCSKIEQKYSCHYPFGFLKNIQWRFSTFIIFASCYTSFFHTHESIEQFIGPAIIFFIHWLLYYCTVHLTEKKDRLIRLSTIFFLDLLISISVTIALIMCYLQSQYFPALVLGLAIFFYTSYSLLLLFTFCNNTSFKIPISINIKVEINQKNIKDEEKEKGEIEEKKKEEN